MSSKFEQLLDYLVNEEQEKANELFHEIVVEKSRDIYESLIAEEEDEEVEEGAEEDSEDEEVEEGMACDSEDEAVESIFGEEEGEEFPVQDQTDDFVDDTEDDEFGGDEFGGEEEAGEPATKDDIQDLEDALEELKAEFEALLSQEEGEGHDVDAIKAAGDEEGEEDEGDDEEADDEENAFESSEEEEEELEESKKSAGQTMREYIEKVAVTMTDGEGVGSGRGDKAGQTGHDSGKSPISSGAGKPTSGANAKNIAQAGKGANEDGQSPKGKVGGLVKTGGDFVKAGTKNVASSANAKKPDGAKLSSVSKPGNKEFAGVGAKTGGELAGQTGSGDTNSPINGAPGRAK